MNFQICAKLRVAALIKFAVFYFSSFVNHLISFVVLVLHRFYVLLCLLVCSRVALHGTVIKYLDPNLRFLCIVRFLLAAFVNCSIVIFLSLWIFRFLLFAYIKFSCFRFCILKSWLATGAGGHSHIFWLSIHELIVRPGFPPHYKLQKLSLVCSLD